MIQLEKYSGSGTRHQCPGCGKKEFARYKTDQGDYVADDVGRCNREVNCGYHKKPAERRAENPANGGAWRKESNWKAAYRDHKPAEYDYHPKQNLIDTQGNYDQNNFVQCLLDTFYFDQPAVWAALKTYFIGTHLDEKGSFNCFPYIDQQGRICKVALLRYSRTTGKRRRGLYDTSTLRAKLRLPDMRYSPTFFGEHLLPKHPGLPIAIVEAPKTAVVASVCKAVFPDCVWIASGTRLALKGHRLISLAKGRKVILYPDADGYDHWTREAREAVRVGADVKVSQLIHKLDSGGDKSDLADYLLRDRRMRNQTAGYSLEDIWIERAERKAIETEHLA